MIIICHIIWPRSHCPCVNQRVNNRAILLCSRLTRFVFSEGMYSNTATPNLCLLQPGRPKVIPLRWSSPGALICSHCGPCMALLSKGVWRQPILCPQYYDILILLHDWLSFTDVNNITVTNPIVSWGNLSSIDQCTHFNWPGVFVLHLEIDWRLSVLALVGWKSIQHQRSLWTKYCLI